MAEAVRDHLPMAAKARAVVHDHLQAGVAVQGVALQPHRLTGRVVQAAQTASEQLAAVEPPCLQQCRTIQSGQASLEVLRQEHLAGVVVEHFA